MSCWVIWRANSGLPTTYCTAFRSWRARCKSAPWFCVPNSMKPLGPAIRSSRALADSGSAPLRSSSSTIGSNFPIRASSAAATSPNGFSVSTWTCSIVTFSMCFSVLVRLCQLSIGRKPVRRSRSFSSRRACSRSQSQMRRCTSGRDTRLRSGRGGKSPTGTSPQGYLLPLLPFLLDQETVSQHHYHTVAVEAGPQPPLILVPAQQSLGLLVKLLHAPAAVRVLHHLLQRRRGAEVAPVVLPLVLTGPFPDQPTLDTLRPRRGHAPTADRPEASLQPALAARAPADRPPGPRRLFGQHHLRRTRRAVGCQRHLEVLADR